VPVLDTRIGGSSGPIKRGPDHLRKERFRVEKADMVGHYLNTGQTLCYDVRGEEVA